MKILKRIWHYYKLGKAVSEGIWVSDGNGNAWNLDLLWQRKRNNTWSAEVRNENYEITVKYQHFKKNLK